jgi:nitrite reductase (NADH) large subunit
MEYLRAVIVEDSLGIAETLEAEMANTLSRYQCEWKETLNDPEKLKRFRAFVNSDSADPSVVVVEERGQIRPATWGEKAELQSVRHRRLPLVERAT